MTAPVRAAVRAVIVLAAVAAVAASARPEPAATKTASCGTPRATAAHTSKVERALRTRHDVWGNALLNAPDGPSYEAARRLLPPLLYARAPRKRALTESGVYYVPFGQPLGARGAGSVALHVADGSQVIAERVGGRRLTVLVGAKGRERYGSCVARLGQARLADGYLPIMSTTYTDGARVRYRQESFAAQTSETGSLVSFIRLDVDARRASTKVVQVRLKPSVPRLRRVLSFSRGGTVKRSVLTYRIRRGTKRTIYLAWINYPGRRTLAVDAARYDRARRAVTAYWNGRLQEGTQIVVPEQRVSNAYRNLVIQNLLLTWRYSIGNPYEQFSFPEGVDVAEVMGELGYPAVARSIMRTSLTRKDTPYPNWKMGKRLVGSALHYRLTRDRAYIESANPTLLRYLDELGRQIADGGGLLGRERYSSDIDEQVLGLHSQATVWQGLRAMGRVWVETGNAELARRAENLADLLEPALRRAVASSQRRLGDGSLFVPARLLDGEPAYGSLTQARLGSYWNLVMPYALASGFFAPGSPEATGILTYMLRHGSRLAGVVRAGAYALYERPVFPVSGTDQVYGIERRPLPRGRRRGRSARAQPLRLAGRGDDAEHVRLGRGCERGAARRPALPLDVPAAERGEQRRLPRDAQVAARPRDPGRRGCADRSRARVRDTAAVAAGRPPDRRSPRADELRPRHVLARGAERHDPRGRGTAGAAGAEDAEAPRSAAARPARRSGDGERDAARAAGGASGPARRSTSAASPAGSR